MKSFQESEVGLISNARCLTEGVDVPSVDMVAFLSAKKSQVDIIQATGRAMRKSENKEKGYILVPLYIEQEKGESVEEAVERSDFVEIWEVLQCLQEQDETLKEYFCKESEQFGKTRQLREEVPDNITFICEGLSFEFLKRA